MTARRERRRRRTVVAAVLTLALVAVAASLVVFGASKVVNSKAGEEVVGDVRPVIELPNTDNAALAVIDGENRLTSLIIATLSPSGVGGSIVTIPVNADASIGFGGTRRPLDAELDLSDPNAFFETLEATLAISLQFGEIVAADRLTTFITPVVPIEVDLAAPVVDSVVDSVVPTDAPVVDSVADSVVPTDAPVVDSVADSVVPTDAPVVEVGEREFDASLTVETLRAHDASGASYDHHQIDVAVWSALAANAPIVGAGDPPPTDEFDRPLPSATIDELFTRLWQGPVQVRDLAVEPGQPTEGVDSVIIDRFDALLVFAQVSPGRVSTPNQGLVFRVVIPFSDAQIESSTDVVGTRSEIAHDLIMQLLFLAANVVSVDTTVAPEGAGTLSRIEVADERFINDMRTLSPSIFGESEVVVAETLIDGVDVVLTLGTSFIDLKETLSDGEAPAESDQSTPGDTGSTEPGAESTEPEDGPTTDGDTVDTDG